MLFTVRRPHYETEFFHPAMRMFQPHCHTFGFGDFLLPGTAMIPLCGHSAEKNLKAKDSPTKKNAFEVEVDVQHYRPGELDVKTVDNYIVVTGKHEEKQDDTGYVSRQFVRRYALPEGVKADSVICNLNFDGVLQISAPLQIENTPPNETKIPISFSEAPAKISSENVIKASNEQVPDEEAVSTNTTME